MKKIDIASLPELKTSVGIQGSTRQKAVVGPICVAVILGVAVYEIGNG